MEDTIQLAHLALMEGDRDEVLRLIENEPVTPESLWLRAQSVLDEKQRLSLVSQLAAENDSLFAPLAAQIYQREKAFEERLSATPDYQFWKQPGWNEKISSLKKQKAWIWAIISVFTILALILLTLLINPDGTSSNLSSSIASPVPMYTPSVTALPVNLRERIQYPAGDFSIVRIELPTTRPVSYSNSSNLDVAVPAIGAHLLAIQYEFLCRAAICNQPPEAQISLKLTNGSVISYVSYNQPVLTEYSSSARVAQNQTASGWLVFEIPIEAHPAALLFDLGSSSDEPLLELTWPR